MMRFTTVLQAAVIALVAAMTAIPDVAVAKGVETTTLKGKVEDVNGKAVGSASVTVTNTSGMGPLTITAFTDATGAYVIPGVPKASADKLKLAVWKVGYEPAQDGDGPNFVVKEVSNVASQIIATSNWVDKAGADNDQRRMLTVLLCGDCHSVAGKVPPMQARAKMLGDLNDPLAEFEGWYQVTDRMRMMFDSFFTTEAEKGAKEGNEDKSRRYSHFNQVAMADEPVFIDKMDMALISSFLAEHIPEEYDTFAKAEWEACCNRAPINTKAVVTQYKLNVEYNDWVREIIRPRGSKYVWANDKTQSRLVKLDPETGSYEFVPVPGNHAGPHSLYLGSDNRLWMSFEDAARLAAYDTFDGQWDISPEYRDSKTGLLLLTHDFAQNWKREPGFDGSGRVWNTLISANKLAGYNPKTRKTETYDLPVPPGRSPTSALVYGTAMTSDGTVWWSQIHGHFGWFDTQTHEAKFAVKFPRGVGARRMVVDEHDMVYVPLYGAGQIMVYDAKKRKEIGRYDLPDRSSAPYSLLYDAKRKIVWVANSNSSSVYAFDPSTKKTSIIPIPDADARLRMLSLDESGNLWGTYGTFPGVPGKTTNVLMIAPGI